MINERIILIQRIDLLRKGVIGSKGTHTFNDYKGVTHSCEMPEDIFTPPVHGSKRATASNLVKKPVRISLYGSTGLTDLLIRPHVPTI